MNDYGVSTNIGNGICTLTARKTEKMLAQIRKTENKGTFYCEGGSSTEASWQKYYKSENQGAGTERS